MKSLDLLENKFQNFLLNADDDIVSHIVSTTKIPATARLTIYHNAYHLRLQEALAANYPILQCYLGDELFAELCAAYIAAYPSQFSSIRWYGNELSSFLRVQEQYQDYPYLVELAQLEWTMALVFDAKDANPLTSTDMAAVPPEAWVDMRLKIHPSVHCLSLTWNVMPIWQAINDDHAPPNPQQLNPVSHWVFWRRILTSQSAELTCDEAWALNAILANSTFGEMCIGLCQWVQEEQAGMHAASLLKGWLMAGLIVKFE